MAGVQDHVLAAVVSNAGGLGSLPCALLTQDHLQRELTALRARTDRPFNVNFFCHAIPAPDATRDAAWRATLAPYYDELGVDPLSIPSGPGRMPFDDDVADIVEPFKPAVVSFHFGLPAPPLLARVRSWGSTILSTATTVDEARWLAAHGADGILAQGIEAGGHRGMFLTLDIATQASTFSLLSGIVRAVDIPVIATGGLADVNDVRRALALGAAAVQIGTAYLLCPEATTSSVHRTAIEQPGSTTSVTNVFTGRPARGILNRLIRELGPMTDRTPEFPLASNAVTPLRTAAERSGSGDFSAMWAGTRFAECRRVSASAITDAMSG